MTTPSIQEPGDWIEWSGGECPVDPLRLVEAKFVDGATDMDVADAYDWFHEDLSSDIIAYRVVSK